jgi:hypothetical protein
VEVHLRRALNQLEVGDVLIVTRLDRSARVPATLRTTMLIFAAKPTWRLRSIRAIPAIKQAIVDGREPIK